MTQIKTCLKCESRCEIIDTIVFSSSFDTFLIIFALDFENGLLIPGTSNYLLQV
jgi:hypothetical protein